MSDGDKFFDDLKHVLKERLSSPLAGTYTLFFLLLNWEGPVALLYGSGPVKDRIEETKEIIKTHVYADKLMAFGLPLGLTLRYVLVIPTLKYLHGKFILRFFENLNAKQQLEDHLARQDRAKFQEDMLTLNKHLLNYLTANQASAKAAIEASNRLVIGLPGDELNRIKKEIQESLSRIETVLDDNLAKIRNSLPVPMTDIDETYKCIKSRARTKGWFSK